MENAPPPQHEAQGSQKRSEEASWPCFCQMKGGRGSCRAVRAVATVTVAILELEQTPDGKHLGDGAESSYLWSLNPPVLEPPGVPTAVSAVVVVRTGIALAT